MITSEFKKCSVILQDIGRSNLEDSQLPSVTKMTSVLKTEDGKVKTLDSYLWNGLKRKLRTFTEKKERDEPPAKKKIVNIISDSEEESDEPPAKKNIISDSEEESDEPSARKKITKIISDSGASESDPHVFSIHNGGITNALFNPFDGNELLTSSLDGTLRCGDMVKHVFSEVYKTTTKCRYFDILSPRTYLVGLSNGMVTLVDQRMRAKRCSKNHLCHVNSIKSVSIHSVDRNVFITAENKGIFDSTNLTQDIKVTNQMKHKNHTEKFMNCMLRATWLPNSEEIFAVGHALKRTVQLYDKNMKCFHQLRPGNLAAITSINIFHPFKPALAVTGKDRNGTVFVFT